MSGWQDNLRGIITGTSAALLICLLVSSAFALTIPVPKARPAESETLARQEIPASAHQNAPQASQQVSAIPLPRARPVHASPNAGSASIAVAPASSRDDILAQISASYAQVQSMRANFIQLSGDRRSSGRLVMMKPGRFRFYYDPPSTLDVVSDGKTVLVQDKKLKTNDSYFLEQTPLRILLENNIDFRKDARVTNVISHDDIIEVRIDESKSALQGQIILYFSKKDLSLQQWSIIDGQGVETNIALSQIEQNIRLETGQFKIDSEALRQDGQIKGN